MPSPASRCNAVNMLQIKVVDTVESTLKAKEQIDTLPLVAVGCSGFEVSKTGNLSLIQVLVTASPYCCFASQTDPNM